VAIKIENGIYALSAIMIGLNTIVLMKRIKNIKINIVSVFMIIGFISMVITFISYKPIVSIVGYGVLFLNLMLWNIFLKNLDTKYLENFFKYLIKLNVGCALIIALSGIYQYYIDSSLFGLALHSIYGDPELMESGRFVRRATGFMGSPQNYSLYVALMTCFVPFLNTSRKRKILIFVVLLFGGIVSGSRAYVIFVLQTIIVTVFLNGFFHIKNINKFFKNTMLVIAIIVSMIIVVNLNFENRTFNRMITFINDWPALQIYIWHLSTVDLLTLWFGKGIGVNERVVIQLLGSKYYQTVGDYYYSYESYILGLFMQSGVFALVSFVSIYISSLKNVFFGNKLYFSILLSIFINLMFTPSFSGLAMSFIIWPLILLPYYLKKTKIHSIKGV
jgi:hypothetical protein